MLIQSCFLCSMLLTIVICPYCPYYVGHCIVCPSNYGLWLALWLLKTFRNHSLVLDQSLVIW